MKLISVIVPTLEEEGYIRKTVTDVLAKAENPQKIEILVIDAGSADGTLKSVRDLDVQIFSKPEFAFKKYKSLNFGIEKAKGDVLLFLDADTILPRAFDKYVNDTLQDGKIVGGAFEFSFEKPDLKLFFLQTVNRLRYRLEQTYYGDQAVFCRKEAAQRVGGYPEQTLMESAFFCSRLLKVGKLKLVKKPIKTSGRRFNEKGFFRVFWFDFSMWVRFMLHLPVDQFGKNYWKFNLKSDG